MQPGYFDPARYRSDSNQHWRSGCPHEELAAGSFDWLQLLVHPEIWVYEGATMRETMDRRSSTPSASCAGSSSPRTESTSMAGATPAACPALPGQHGRDPVGELAGASAARRRVRPARLQPLQAPSRGGHARSSGTGGLLRQQATQWRAFLRAPAALRRVPLLLERHARARSRCSSGSCTRSARRASTSTSAPTSAARRASSSRTVSKADAEIVSSYDAIRWVPDADVILPGVEVSAIAAGDSERRDRSGR